MDLRNGKDEFKARLIERAENLARDFLDAGLKTDAYSDLEAEMTMLMSRGRDPLETPPAARRNLYDNLGQACEAYRNLYDLSIRFMEVLRLVRDLTDADIAKLMGSEEDPLPGIKLVSDDAFTHYSMYHASRFVLEAYVD